MNHADALNKILAHSCPRDTKDGISTFHLDLCCEEVYVKAIPLGDYQYEILSVDLVLERSIVSP
jgi:hypothetical protein